MVISRRRAWRISSALHTPARCSGPGILHLDPLVRPPPSAAKDGAPRMQPAHLHDDQCMGCARRTGQWVA